jgi:hypothetical protein
MSWMARVWQFVIIVTKYNGCESACQVFVVIAIMQFSLIDYLYCFTSAQEFFAYMETSPIVVKGCKIYANARRSGPLSREGSISSHICNDTGFRFFRSHPQDQPHSVASYDTQRGCGGRSLTSSRVPIQSHHTDLFLSGSSRAQFSL